MNDDEVTNGTARDGFELIKRRSAGQWATGWTRGEDERLRATSKSAQAVSRMRDRLIRTRIAPWLRLRMTQIISIQRRYEIIHASDRLLTTKVASDAHDRRSNKSIVLASRDTLAVIDYSGDAMQGRIPMDEWFAGALRRRADESWEKPGFLNDVAELTLPRVPSHLRTWLERRHRKLAATERHDAHLEVQVVGFNFRAGSFAERLAASVRLVSGMERADALELPGPRTWLSGTTRIIATPELPSDEREQLDADITAATNSSERATAAVAAIRRAADAGRPVGRDVMCLSLAPRRTPPCRLSFSYEGAPDTTQQRRIAYTPWVISHGGVMAPMVTSLPEFGFAGQPPFMTIDGVGAVLSGGEFHAAAFTQSRAPKAEPSSLEVVAPPTRKVAVYLTKGPHTIEVRGSSPKRGKRKR